jgi:multidrug efflux pump subunit AcrA (membrane-fusion protein)
VRGRHGGSDTGSRHEGGLSRSTGLNACVPPDTGHVSQPIALAARDGESTLAVALRGALTVPSAAIQTGPDGKFAWVVGEGDVVKARPITPGPTTDGRVAIASGLTDGDRVVVSGQYKLRQNSKVTLTLQEPAVAKQALAP